MTVHAVGVGTEPSKLRCLALQGNFSTFQSILLDYLGEGLWGDDKTPSHAEPHLTEQAKEAPHAILFQYGQQAGKFLVEGFIHFLN